MKHSNILSSSELQKSEYQGKIDDLMVTNSDNYLFTFSDNVLKESSAVGGNTDTTEAL